MDADAKREPPLLVILGCQGSGKGEQSERLAQRLGLDHVSTGALLRAAVRAGTGLGRSAAASLERGEPVPDDLVAGIVAERLAVADALGRGVVLDGFPRSVAQAERLRAIRAPAAIDLAIQLEVPRQVAVARIQNRRVCEACGWSGVGARCARCGALTTRRADDWPAAIGRRLHDHAVQVAPLLAWFDEQGILEIVDGVGTIDEVAARVAAAVDRRSGAGV